MYYANSTDELIGVEHQVAAIRHDLELYGEAFATLHGRMDRMDSRIERIERRLDLNDA